LLAVRQYCEIDALNTYLIWLRFELLRGHLDATGHASELERLRQMLRSSSEPHLAKFLSAWEALR
jgi:predicted PolB exonuclease-like 3'-5' exonuclease